MEKSTSEKLTVARLVTKIPVRNGTRRFTTVYRGARHRSQSRARWIQSTPKHYFPMTYFNIILPSTPMSSEWPLPFRLPNKNVVRISHPRYIPRPSHPPLFDHPNNIWWRLQTVELLMQFPPVTRHFIPLRRKVTYVLIFWKLQTQRSRVRFPGTP
jgi:hypothetical protein